MPKKQQQNDALILMIDDENLQSSQRDVTEKGKKDVYKKTKQGKWQVYGKREEEGRGEERRKITTAMEGEAKEEYAKWKPRKRALIKFQFMEQPTRPPKKGRPEYRRFCGESERSSARDGGEKRDVEINETLALAVPVLGPHQPWRLQRASLWVRARP